MNKSEMAAQIVAARKSGEQTQMALPDPAPNRDDAMDIQAEAFAQLGSPSVGWKVGATNEAAQKGFGIDSPFFGPIAELGVMASGENLKKTPCVGAVEPEYAFKMAKDFPSDGEALTVENAKSAVGSVHLAIEVIGRCIGNPDYANGVGVTMDFGGNAAFVVGPEVSDWANQDFANTVVEAMVDGEVVQTGNGQPVMGDPINSIVWLAEQLVAKGESIKAGQWVSTGTCTAAVPGVAGKTVSAKYGGFGEVSVNFN